MKLIGLIFVSKLKFKGFKHVKKIHHYLICLKNISKLALENERLALFNILSIAWNCSIELTNNYFKYT